MQILQFPDKRLLTECKEVDLFNQELKDFLEQMWTIMTTNRGIGLAANQIGLNKKMFVMRGQNNEKLFVVNPIILKQSKYPALLKEGCLSAPGEFVMVKNRPQWVELSFQDENSNCHIRVFRDILSVCVSHEIEHLEGKSFLNSITSTSDILKRWGLND